MPCISVVSHLMVLVWAEEGWGCNATQVFPSKKERGSRGKKLLQKRYDKVSKFDKWMPGKIIAKPAG